MEAVDLHYTFWAERSKSTLIQTVFLGGVREVCFKSYFLSFVWYMLLLYNDSLSWISGKMNVRGQGSLYKDNRGGSSSFLPCGDNQTGQRDHEHCEGTSQVQCHIRLSCPTACEPTGRFYSWFLVWETCLFFFFSSLQEFLGQQGDQTSQSKGYQPWIFTGRTDAEAEAPILWSPDMKSQLIGQDPDAGKDWGQEEMGAAEDEMVGWHHWLKGHEFEQTPGDSEGQESLACCNSWGRRVRHDLATENNNKYWCILMTPR